MAGAKPVTSNQMREVKKLEVPALGRIDYTIYTVGSEQAEVPVPPGKIKVSTTLIKPMDTEHSKERKNAMGLGMENIRGNELAVLTSISDIPRSKRY